MIKDCNNYMGKFIEILEFTAYKVKKVNGRMVGGVE